jgi:hypothetical protein
LGRRQRQHILGFRQPCLKFVKHVGVSPEDSSPHR